LAEHLGIERKTKRYIKDIPEKQDIIANSRKAIAEGSGMEHGVPCCQNGEAR
jgi:hypothetical protein